MTINKKDQLTSFDIPQISQELSSLTNEQSRLLSTIYEINENVLNIVKTTINNDVSFVFE